MPVMLHAVAVHTRLALWGEITDARAASPPPRLVASAGPPHPAAADIPVLLDLLRSLGLNRDPLQFLPHDHKTLWLPTSGDHPIQSDTPSPANTPALTLHPWSVPTLLLDGATTLLVIDGYRQQLRHNSRARASGDLLFWLRVETLARFLVLHQHFIPGMRQLDDGTFVACWEPYVTPDSQSTLEQLALSMPGVARAWGTDAQLPPTHNPLTILQDVMTTIIDAQVRQTAAPARQRHVAQSAWRYYSPAATPSLPERWKTALHPGESPIIQATTPHLQNLHNKIRHWHTQLAERPANRFRLCFRLSDVTEEIDEQDVVHWRLAVSLQSRADPSLMLPLADIWHTERLTTGNLQGVTHAEILSTLGSTIALIPPLARSLEGEHPGVVELTTHEAFTFLTHATTTLQQLDHLVQLPTWWHAAAHPRSPRLHAQIRNPLPSSGLLGMETLLAFSWELALGDDPITQAELEELARHKEPLVRLRGQWMHVDQDAIATALQRLRRRPAAPIPVREALTLALAATDKAEDSVDPGAWLADLLDRLRTKTAFAEIPPPTSLCVPLRPYQARAYAWIHFLTRFGFSACLSDQMGLGKTLSTLAVIGQHWHEHGAKPTLVVAPVSVIDHWRQETARSFPDLPVVIYHGARRQETRELLSQAGIVVTSYGILQRDQDVLQAIHWRAIIADEAQAIKNAATQQAHAMRHLTADYRIALTGTPVENSVDDVWSLFEFLHPGYLGSHAAFTRSFGVPITQHDAAATATLRQLIGPFILRRLKSDPEVAPDLPPKLELTAYCNLTREQASLYAAAVQTLQRDLLLTTGIQRRGLILRSLTHLKQICNAPSHFLKDGSSLAGRSGKVTRLEEILEEMLANGERGLIFTQFAELGDPLQRHLAKRFGQPVFYLHGQTPKPERDRLIAAFQRGEAPIFVLSLKAGGAGITLTAATHVIHIDRWWNPAVEDQASDRAHRIGQHQTVTVHRLICKGTIEERIDELQAGKRAMADGIIVTGEDQLTELDTETLLELVRLQAEEIPV